ncbi:hypothetical protein GGI20_001895 [Coemansia sp. BCRC 34301]|nr:hypothetical protein GGI20_001895 [Coemansia sp. BCRC 34301]
MMATEPVDHKTRFWARVFQPLHPDERYVKLRRRTRTGNQPQSRQQQQAAPTARHSSWRRRSYAYSAASAATAVAAQTAKEEEEVEVVAPPRGLASTIPQEQQQQRQRDGGVMEQFPVPDCGAADFCITPSSGFLVGCSDYSLASSFWRTYDRRISVGGLGAAGRVIVDAMVDDVVTSGAVDDGWRVDAGRGTFNDVLSNTNSLHPIVMAFARAHVESAHVILGPDHVWLAVLQGVAGVLRHSDPELQRSAGSHSVGLSRQVAGASSAQYAGASHAPDLGELWRVLRASSGIPTACTASSGHVVHVFGGDMSDRHALYGGRGAAPVAMAAAAAGHGRGVEYGQIGVGSRSVAWQPHQRQTNPAWTTAVAGGAGVRSLRLAGSLQAWAALCVLTRQIKAMHSGRSRGFDWWLHRVHLLSRDLADYFAAQDEFTGDLPGAWRRWLDSALFDGHSGPPRGARLDGWLAALFPLDAHGAAIHKQDRWWVDWDAVPAGVDLLRASVAGSWANLYSGFVGVQQLSREGSRRRDHAATLVDDDKSAPAKPRSESDNTRAIAPLIGWAMDQ